MTLLDDNEAAIKALNLDRLPTHIVDKRVTELMDLTGKKAFVTVAGGDGLGHAGRHRRRSCVAGIGRVQIRDCIRNPGGPRRVPLLMTPIGLRTEFQAYGENACAKC